MIAKAEGEGERWHGHITAVTVHHDYRRIGIAQQLISLFENTSDKEFRTYFVDLYVRMTNTTAIEMYRALNYVIYRQVIHYYSGVYATPEDAYDMRKACSRDVERKSEIPHDPLRVEPSDADRG
jgi:N-terminal acetyltransferase B complex catalytic subunit